MVCSLCEGGSDGLCDVCEAKITKPYQLKLTDVECQLAEAQAELAPSNPQETLLGAIRNLQQAYLSADGNCETLEAKLAEVMTGLAALSPTLANDPRPVDALDALRVVAAEYTALVQDHAKLEGKLAEAVHRTRLPER